VTGAVARGGSPLLVTLVALLAWALLILVVTRARYSSDTRALIVVGARKQLPPAFATIPTASPWGYDGQMYAALATDPFLRQLDTPHYLDTPWYRATRVGVPALAWLAALGNPSAAVVCYQLLCWGLAIAAVYVLARWLREEGRSPWWALLAAGSGGVAAAILRSTPDGAALFFIVAALWLHSRGRWLAALALAAVAVLTRETSLLAALAIAADEVRRRSVGRAVAFAAVPAAAGVAWQLHLRHLFGTAFDTGTRNFAVPFAWLPHKLAVVFLGDHVQRVELVGTLAILASACALLVVASRPAALDAPALTFGTFALLGLFLAYSVYSEAWAYARALIVLPALAVLVAGREPIRWRRHLVTSVAVLYFVVGAGLAAGEVRDALHGRGIVRAMAEGTPVPLPSASARSGIVSRPAGVASQPPLWVLPVANVKGRAGAVWQTRLVLENPRTTGVRATLELHLTTMGRADAESRTVVVGPRGHVEWRNVVGELFGRSGSGAIRVIADGGRVSARSLTANVTAAGPGGDLLPALTEANIVHRDELVRFEELAHDPDRGAEVRTNIGVFNLGETPIKVRIEAFDSTYNRLGTFEGLLGSYRFTQVDDLFARFGAPRLDGASAQVSAPSRGGSFLAYASVIRGPSSPAVYLYPKPVPAGHPGR